VTLILLGLGIGAVFTAIVMGMLRLSYKDNRELAMLRVESSLLRLGVDPEDLAAIGLALADERERQLLTQITDMQRVHEANLVEVERKTFADGRVRQEEQCANCAHRPPDKAAPFKKVTSGRRGGYYSHRPIHSAQHEFKAKDWEDAFSYPEVSCDPNHKRRK